MKECPKYVSEGGNIHAEIEYSSDGNGNNVHSDICPPGCSMTGVTSSYAMVLSNALREWLAKSNGTGYFYVGNWDDMAEAFGNTMIEVGTGAELHD
mgnify:CR=1 FL=1|tara:strand:+ start:1977 stop:2264 length:288 start_codon:yes stop_codon:yes gene_type:complete